MLRNLGTLVLMLLLATPLAVVAQNTGRLAGVVVDDLGDPLPGANVVVGGTQLGAATDIDGNYFIIGVPVGTYDITASFVGYQTQTVEEVQISTGYTTEQNFELGPQELGEVVVTYERPIIQRDAIGVPKVVTGEDIENLPIRGVASIAAIQSGVVANEGSDDLFVRGGREQEVAYYVDGVKVTGGASVAVNQQAIQEQEMLIGTIPARYGDVQSGVISITTKSGGSDFFGSVEAITSEVLDDYGYNLGSLNIGGPIVPGRASFFASIGGQHLGDRNPYGISTLTLTDEAAAALFANPQSLRVRDAAGEPAFIPFPTDLPAGTSVQDVLNDPAAFGIDLPAGYEIVSTTPISTAETYTRDQFTSRRGKDSPYQEITFNGNVTLDLIETLSLRMGGAFERSGGASLGYGSSFYNPDNRSEDDRQTWRAYGTFRQRLSDRAFYQIQGEVQNYSRDFYPNRFSSNIEDALFVGDIDHPANELATLYYTIENGQYVRRARDSSFGATSAYGTFQTPGVYNTRFIKEDNSLLRFSGNATTQLGVHQLEFGAEFEQQTRRYFDFSAAQLARYFADGSSVTALPDFPEGVSSYDQLPYEVFEPLYNFEGYYGYSFNGLMEVDDENIGAFASGENRNVAPHKPIYYAGYVQDKIEFRDLVINLGLRVDVFDNNTPVLRDPFAPLPILRAGDLANYDQFAGFGIGQDYAAYFSNQNDPSTVIGFRDADGRFYDLQGNATTQRLIDAAGRNIVTQTGLSEEMFEDYTPQVTFMPRLGVSFPVTDRALFFASYNVTAQRPTEQAFTPFSTYAKFEGRRIGNPALEPEKTTQYELGFRQRVGERAAVTLSGFYRTQENKIAVRNMNQIGAPEQFAYSTYLNADFSTSQGVELAFDLRRTNNLAVNANYTLSFSQGTGSDASTAGTIAWQSGSYPNFLSPTDFDRRHTANISVDYRLGDDEGPMLFGARPFSNFGFNVLGNFRSGQPYTPIIEAGNILSSTSPLDPRGAINDARLPGSTTIDLKIDRNFELGFGGLKAYLWVLNVLDTEGVQTVYRFTGSPRTSGYLEAGGGLGALLSETVPESAIFNYTQYEQGPVYLGQASATSSGTTFYTPPRRIRLGVLLNF